MVIDTKFLIYETDLSFAFTNLKPALEGHILVCPKRCVQFFHELTDEEKIDLSKSMMHVGKVMKEILNKKFITMTIQDGPFSGQTVPHVHGHIFVRNNHNEKFCSKPVPKQKRIEYSALYRSYFEKYQ